VTRLKQARLAADEKPHSGSRRVSVRYIAAFPRGSLTLFRKFQVNQFPCPEYSDKRSVHMHSSTPHWGRAHELHAETVVGKHIVRDYQGHRIALGLSIF